MSKQKSVAMQAAQLFDKVERLRSNGEKAIDALEKKWDERIKNLVMLQPPEVVSAYSALCRNVEDAPVMDDAGDEPQESQ
jgi:hypothetical protein